MAKDNQGSTDRAQGACRRAIRERAYGRPRLSVFRSSKQIYAQIIDDEKGATLSPLRRSRRTMREALKTGADDRRRQGRRQADRRARRRQGRQGSRVRPRRATCITAASRRWPTAPAKAAWNSDFTAKRGASRRAAA